MQKLDRRNTYTPPDTAQVRCNCDSVLKVPKGKDGVLSLKTLSNNSEEHLHSGKSGQDLRVPVLNMRGDPLMPTTPRKARKILEQGKAKVIHRTPFTIQLLYITGENKQDITLGIDPAYSKIGYCAISKDKELIAGEVELRNDIKKLLEKRAAYRRTRRGRLWHREPRFDNRSREEGWFAPSIQHKLDSHIKLIDRLKSILPITKVVVEIATFDQQKMQNPEISGVEYQQGELLGYEVREYLLEKWQRKCAYCGKTNIPLEIEHIIPKSKGGSNRVSNLTIACHACNQAKGNQTAKEFGHPTIQAKAKKPLKSAAFMNIVKKKLVELLDCETTYGYITKHDRIQLDLPKSHINDAFVIAGGTDQVRSEYTYISKQVRRQNRSLYKANLLKGGRLKRNTVKEVKGFKRFDKVKFENKESFIYALRRSGYFDIRSITGDKLGASVNNKKLTLLERAKGIIIQVVRGPFPPWTEVCGLHSPCTLVI